MHIVRIVRLLGGEYRVRLQQRDTHVILKTQLAENLTQARRRAKLWAELYCDEDGTACDIEEKLNEP